MNKLIALLIVLGSVVAPSAAQPAASAPSPDAPSFSMALLRAGVFLASDSAYKDVYGTKPVFGLEVRLGKRALAGWVEATLRTGSGKSTFTKEDTKCTILGLEAGGLYRFLAGKISAYAGVGLGYYTLKESNAFIGESSGGGLGFCAVAGAAYAITSSIVADVRLKYSTAKMKPADFDINAGGLTLGAGIGIRL